MRGWLSVRAALVRFWAMMDHLRGCFMRRTMSRRVESSSGVHALVWALRCLVSVVVEPGV